MRNKKKPFKYYVYIFILSSVIVLGYSIYMYYSDKAEIADLISLWFMPIIFTGIYYGGDVLMLKIANRKQKPNYEGDFLKAVSAKMRESNQFLIEDYRKLQTNQKFQDSLKIAFQIYQNGETEQWNVGKLEKRFRPQTIESKAMNIVIELIQKKDSEATN